ncbi:MAG: hypothetical protein J5640_05090 [Bacteroidales bacterium]|nr:hypothetical protein [Bacteroidales bacterium]
MYKRLLLVLLTLAVVMPGFGAYAQKGKAVDEPLIDFTHRYANIHMTMTLTKLKTFNKFLPKSLRREVGDEYYPEIRRQLKGKESGSMHYKEGDADIVSYPDGKVRLTLKFPNFIMVIRNVDWDQLDRVFSEYF